MFEPLKFDCIIIRSAYEFNIGNGNFDQMVNKNYPKDLQINKTNVSYTEASFLNLNSSISNDKISIKIYYKQDDIDLIWLIFRFLDGDLPRSTVSGVYISQLFHFARATS